MRFPSGPGQLRNAAKGMCLDVAGWNAAGDGDVLLWECNGDPDQVWSFAHTGELVNATGTCLDVTGYDGAPGRNVGVFQCEGVADQRWSLVPVEGDRFMLHNRKQNICLDVVGKNGNKGDNVLLWSCDAGRDQTWYWEPASERRLVRRRPPGVPPEYVREQPADPGMGVLPPGEFDTLLRAVAAEGFSAGKLRVIESAAQERLFTVQQLKRFVQALSFSADKIRAVELVASRIVDRDKLFTLYDAFSFEADKETVRRILKHR